MTIQTEINRIKTGIQNVYTVMEAKHATIPATKNLNNLVTTGETLPDFTLMGNQLRKACAYTYTEDISGMCQVFSYDSSSDVLRSSNPIEVKNFLKLSSGNIIIDGKLYTFSTSNSDIILTQYGTDEDWETYMWSDQNNYSKNGIIYISGSPTSLQAVNPVFGYNFFINDGKLYKNSRELVDDSGIWTDIWYAGYPDAAIKDGHLYANSWGDNELKQVSKNPANMYTGYNIQGYGIKENYTIDIRSGSIVYTYPENISKGVGTFILLENGDLYNGSQKILENVFDITLHGNDKFTCSVLALTSSTLYRIPASSLTLRTLCSLNIEQGSFMKKPIEWYSSGNTFGIIYGENSLIKETLYGIHSHNDITRVYNQPNRSTSYTTSFSLTNSSMIINNKEYIRDESKDSVFTFIPPDLRNHTFNDQELCQAYLNAGVIAESNS